MSLTLAAIGGVVAAAVKYLLASKGMELAATKAVERIGEMGGAALVNAGKNALAKLRAALAERGEDAKKAQTALSNLENDPEDEDYQGKLVKELDKLSANDVSLRALLEQLSTDVQQASSGSPVQGTVAVSDEAKVYGNAIGVNTGTISGTYTFGDEDDD